MVRTAALFVMVLVSACARDAVPPSGGDPAELLESCTKTADCPSGERCLSGFCPRETESAVDAAGDAAGASEDAAGQPDAGPAIPDAGPGVDGGQPPDVAPQSDGDGGPTGDVVPVGDPGPEPDDTGTPDDAEPEADAATPPDDTAGPGADAEADGGAPDAAVDACVPACQPAGCGDDGCGGSCGTCQYGAACVAGLCVCAGDGELCNGQDDDCDGLTDEPADLSPADAGCKTAGVCAGQVTVTCDGSGTLGCDYGAVPSFEAIEVSCDGRDNDCDGLTDEGVVPPQGVCPSIGVCDGLTPTCQGAGGWVCPYGALAGYRAVEGAADCDSLDNDCDGLTDEANPTLGTACTRGVGSCAQSGTRVCAADHATVVCSVSGAPAGQPCDDGSACTYADRCSGGDASACAGTAYGCDDGLDCTLDTCGGTGPEDCTHTPQAGACVIGGACVAAGALDPQNDCRACDPAHPDGWTDSALGTLCDDGNECTVDDACTAGGACAGDGFQCDDGLTCTRDLCVVGGAPSCDFSELKPGTCLIDGVCWSAGQGNPDNPCAVCDPSQSATAWWGRPDGTGCTDGRKCTVGDACQGGTCQGAPRDCTDQNECTSDGCDDAAPAVDGCTHAPLTATVCTDDGRACTSDVCAAGSCTHPIAPGACLIDGACWTDGQTAPTSPCLICNSATGPTTWSTLPAGTGCDDGNGCTRDDACTGGGKCSGIAMSAADCDDSNPCTADTCPATSGCVHAPVADGAPCPADSLACTVDQCLGGTCDHATIGDGRCLVGGACYTNGALAPGQPCRACRSQTSQTAFTALPDGTACNDGAECTVDATCAGAVCAGTYVHSFEVAPVSGNRIGRVVADGNGGVYAISGGASDGGETSILWVVADGSVKGVFPVGGANFGTYTALSDLVRVGSSVTAVGRWRPGNSSKPSDDRPWAVQITSEGKVDWSQDHKNAPDATGFSAVVALSGGGYAMGGGAGLMGTDASGDVVWTDPLVPSALAVGASGLLYAVGWTGTAATQRRFTVDGTVKGDTKLDDAAASAPGLVALPGGDLVVVANQGEYDLWVSRRTPAGLEVWTKQLQTPYPGQPFVAARHAARRADGGILIVGETRYSNEGNAFAQGLDGSGAVDLLTTWKTVANQGGVGVVQGSDLGFWVTFNAAGTGTVAKTNRKLQVDPSCP